MAVIRNPAASAPLTGTTEPAGRIPNVLGKGQTCLCMGCSQERWQLDRGHGGDLTFEAVSGDLQDL